MQAIAAMPCEIRMPCSKPLFHRCGQADRVACELDALTARLAAQPPPAMAADVEALRQEVRAS